jgi:hypothetical protein
MLCEHAEIPGKMPGLALPTNISLGIISRGIEFSAAVTNIIPGVVTHDPSCIHTAPSTALL